MGCSDQEACDNAAVGAALLFPLSRFCCCSLLTLLMTVSLLKKKKKPGPIVSGGRGYQESVSPSDFYSPPLQKEQDHTSAVHVANDAKGSKEETRAQIRPTAPEGWREARAD